MYGPLATCWDPLRGHKEALWALSLPRPTTIPSGLPIIQVVAAVKLPVGRCGGGLMMRFSLVRARPGH